MKDLVDQHRSEREEASSLQGVSRQRGKETRLQGSGPLSVQGVFSIPRFFRPWVAAAK